MPRTARPEKLGPNRWRIRWHDHTGKRRSKLYTSFDAAQQALRAQQAFTDEIRHGLRPKPPADRTFVDLATYWESNILPTKRSAKGDLSILRAHLRPAFGPLLLRQITTERADTFISARAHLAPFTIRNHRALLLAMLRKAVSLGWLERLPEIRASRVDPDDEDDPPRLSQEEVERLLDAAHKLTRMEDPYSEIPHVVYAVAVFSGLRAGELAGLRWPDVADRRRAATDPYDMERAVSAIGTRARIPKSSASDPKQARSCVPRDLAQGAGLSRVRATHDWSPNSCHLLSQPATQLRVQLASEWREPGSSSPCTRPHEPKNDRALCEHRWLSPARALSAFSPQGLRGVR